MTKQCERCHKYPAEYVVEFYGLEDGAVFAVCVACARDARKLQAAVMAIEVYAAM